MATARAMRKRSGQNLISRPPSPDRTRTTRSVGLMDHRAIHPNRNAQTSTIAGVDSNTMARTHTGPWRFTSARYSDRPSNPALRTRKTGMADCNAVPIPAITTPETTNAAGAMQHQGSAVITKRRWCESEIPLRIYLFDTVSLLRASAGSPSTSPYTVPLTTTVPLRAAA